MSLHRDTFNYLTPTEKQKADMQSVRVAAHTYASAIDALVPDGPDKTYIMRSFRTVTMWVNIAITRMPDGTPREDD